MSVSILFVCLGNICRSPLAEGAMRALADGKGLDWTIDSAGTGPWHIGEPPDPRAMRVAADNGVDISEQRARQIQREDFHAFDHIVALDAQILAHLHSSMPDDASAALSLFFDHVEGREGGDVADPYYGGEEGFAVTWADVNAGAEALAAKL
ncbi:low molecular weight protein-tyrosine-phosphatase [Parasphingopyxis marina]|uniref:protein-tyrosine-phosphatase n=1 Tax=Parasphingopyxis marina TaxID=2761622 RepID=A0A842I0C3_9SPHN|nr:low molecular weight protein-tyrosine-phosphatase [Parasphingopyxis marina]MBC2778287.1 low molecular weight phosphotyrosine protein phosphatase [Parasphingopyxis marina]